MKKATLSFVVASILAAPSAFADDARGAEGLRVDLERIVSAEEGAEWFVDRTHLDAIYPTVMQSVCRATPSARELTLARIAAEGARLGDARALFKADGAVTARIDAALHAERLRAALEMAMAGAEKDCPFWSVPREDFDGRQTDRHRW